MSGLCSGPALAQADAWPSLIEVESYLHANLDVHRFAIFHRRLEAPLVDCLNGFLVETEPKPSNHTNIPRMTFGIHDEPQDAGSLYLRLCGLFGINRIRGRNRLWRRDAASHVKNSPTNTAACSGTDAGSVALADSPTRA